MSMPFSLNVVRTSAYLPPVIYTLVKHLYACYAFRMKRTVYTHTMHTWRARNAKKHKITLMQICMTIWIQIAFLALHVCMDALCVCILCVCKKAIHWTVLKTPIKYFIISQITSVLKAVSLHYSYSMQKHKCVSVPGWPRWVVVVCICMTDI